MKDVKSEQQVFLKSLVGSWEGTCRTWFEPGKRGDSSVVTGEFQLVLSGRFLRHTYSGSLQGKARKGEELIAYNAVKGNYQVSWIDDFHMSYGIMLSEGEPTPTGFVVLGHYAVGGGNPEWGWKTVYESIDEDHLAITAYNVTPNGQEAKAVETKYKRKP